MDWIAPEPEDPFYLHFKYRFYFVLYAVLGSILVALTIGLIYFWREYFTIWMGKNYDRGYYYNYLNIKGDFYPTLFFTGLVCGGHIFAICFTWSHYIYKAGFVANFLFFIHYCVDRYIINGYDFDLIDDFWTPFEVIKQCLLRRKLKS